MITHQTDSAHVIHHDTDQITPQLGGRSERLMATNVQLGHPTRARRSSTLWYLPNSAFTWQTVYLHPYGFSQRRGQGSGTVRATCKTCGLQLQLTVIDEKTMRKDRKEQGIITAVAFAVFAVLLILAVRSPTALLILLNIAVGSVAVSLWFGWAKYSEASRAGRWHGHRLRP